MKTIVVTGVTGSIGRSLIEVAISLGYEVLALTHGGSSRNEELEDIHHCHVMKLDISEYDHAKENLDKQGISLDNYELFFHLAWRGSFGGDRENLEVQIDNVRATLAAVRLANRLGCSTFIGAGSQAEYGRVDGVLSPDTGAFPETGYGVAKLCAGQLSRLLCDQLGMKHIWCRILSAYGPYDREQSLISTAVRNMITNEETLFTPCEQIWDFIYAEDAARAMILAGQKGEAGKVYVIGSGESHPLKEYIVRIADITGYKKEIGFGKRPYNDKQVMYLKADISDLRKIGFETKTDFDSGIRRIIDHLS